MHFTHLADRAIANPFHRLTDVVARMPLVAHLGGDARFPGHLRELAGFINRAREGFLAVNAFAGFHRRHRGHRVDVVRRRDQDRVNIPIRAFQHPPIIDKHSVIRSLACRRLLVVLGDCLPGRTPSSMMPIVKMAVIPKLGDVADRADVDIRLLQ